MLNLIKIEKEKVDDVKMLSMVASEIVKDYYDPIIGSKQNDYMIKKFQSLEGIMEQLEEGHIYYLAKSESEEIGFLSFYPKESKLYLNKFYLHKNARGKGCGKELMEFIKNQAKEMGYKAVFLNVNKYNDDSINIYKHFGFQIIREEKNPIGNGFYMDDYVLECEVN